ncbi:glycoside hydrolase family 16 protein [Nakamurella alba]|nr:glycoside hydrolase family 16 protein [Nakamurella alba]
MFGHTRQSPTAFGQVRRGTRARLVAVVGAVLAVAGTVFVLPDRTSSAEAAASAATTARGQDLRITIAGTTVDLRNLVWADTPFTASRVGVCLQGVAPTTITDALALPAISTTTVTTLGIATQRTVVLPAGTYTASSCVQRGVGRVVEKIGIAQPFTVAAAAGGVSKKVSAPTSPSGQSMPIGNLPGWKQVFAEDFTTPVARGGFPGPYAGKWMSYHGFADTYKAGTYNQGIISASGGVLDLYLHAQNGRAQVAAPVPLVNGKWGGQTYGRYTVRFRSDPLPGYKTAWLLWPDSNNWNEGEIDFPEGNLGGTIHAFSHCVGNPQANCGYKDTGARYTSWHTATVEWTQGRVVFLLDGKQVLVTTSGVPSTPMHLVLQTESTSSTPDLSRSGHLQIDWVALYTRT